MKIALISHLYPTAHNPHHGKFIQDHYDLLSNSSDYHVSLIVPTPYSIPFSLRRKKNSSPLLDQNNSTRVHYVSFPKRKFPTLVKCSLSKRIIPVIKSGNFDFVHIHWLNPDGMLVAPLKRQGFKVVITIHGSDWYLCYQNPSLKPHIEQTLKLADKVLYSGPKLKEDVEKQYPFVKEKSEIIFNMVDTEKYQPVSRSEKLTIKKELNWNTSRLNVLTVASLRPEKGVDLLVDVIIKTPSLEGLNFHIIGSQENTAYSKEIVNNINSNPFRNIYLHKPIPPNDLIRYYQAADFYVLPSRREGFNVSILEAAACGLPLLCTDVGGNKEVSKMGTGILVDKNSKLSKSILEMIKTINNYDASNLHRIIDSRFGNNQFLERLSNIYKTL